MSAEPLPFEVTEVSVVSGAEFAALTQGVQPDLPPNDPAEIEQPVIDETPPAPTVETPPEVPDAPTAVEPPAPETPPAAPDLTVPETVVTDAPPDVPDTPTIVAPPPSVELGQSIRPVPRPAPRVAPEIVAPPPPDATVAPDVAQAATDQTDVPVEEETDVADETTAPEIAADQIVTEAEDPSFAPEISSRPQTRPQRTAVAQTPTEDAVDPVAAALAAAGAADTPAPTPNPGLSGGELSDGQKADLRREIRNCWSVGSASTAALNTTVVVEWTMNPNGSIDGSSFELVSFSGGARADAEVAYRMARSAIARCQNDSGRNGYSLPSEQFSEPQRLRLAFDPSEMRLR
ncbi:hypothetical protein GQR58_002116 [Nymphon striatum]|nr:hypothetical protein GQR58_002116 [Nymphon striatum]